MDNRFRKSLTLAVATTLLIFATSVLIATNPRSLPAQVFGGPGLLWGLETAGENLPLSQLALDALIIAILVIALDLVALLAVVAIIVAGFYLVLSGGDEGRKDTAKKTIIYTLVGLIIIILSRVIVTFVNSLF